MPTPIELTILGIIVSITIPGLAAYGNLRDQMATLKSAVSNLREEDERNTKAIRHEAQRNDMQDQHLSTIRETMGRIDTNVQRLLENETLTRHANQNR